MGKLGGKQKKKPKITVRRQSEQVKAAAQEADTDESSDTFDEILVALAGANPRDDKR